MVRHVHGHESPEQAHTGHAHPENAAIGMLTHEHQIIMRVVNALGARANALAQRQAIEPQALRDAVRFMREFADKCHHAKEENILFPEMAKHGVPEAGCPLEALRREHVNARLLVTTLSERTEAYAKGETGSADALMAVIADIGHLYVSHIWKEDNMVFPMVDRLFPRADIMRLAERFELAEQELGQDHQALERFAMSLERSGPARETA